MTLTTTPKTWSAEELADRVFEACLGAFDVYTMHIGRKLGLYEHLADGSHTAEELAQRTGTSERYVREWLEQQAVSGIVEVAEPSTDDRRRRYRLPAGYAEVLTDHDSLWYFGPAASMVAAAGVQVPQLVEAFRSGGGVAWDDFGDDMRVGQGEMNRPLFLHVLGREWLAGESSIDELLGTPSARVADIGSGLGWSAIGIANTYPDVEVVGFDVDEPSVTAANANAAGYDVADRVTFRLENPIESTEDDSFDLAIICEALHDMPDPVGVLSGARRLVREGGPVLVLDERTHDHFTADAGDMERLLYGFSVTTCLPDGLSHGSSAGTGTVMRRPTLERYARDAGFGTVDEIDIDHEQFRLYRLS